MKTVKNSLGVLMLMVFLSGATSAVLAQGRGNGNGNGTGGGNPGRGNDQDNKPGKGHDQDYHNGNDRDFNSDRDRSKNHGSGNDKDDDRGRGNDKKYDDRDHRDRNNNDRYNSSSSWDNHRYQSYDHRHRYVTYNHHRQAHPSWAPAYGHRYNTRYIYYQDYNVYYDCHRDVFVTWNGRNWKFSNRIPDVMYRVDFRRTRVAGVDYWEDDFDFYLQRRRPAYVSIAAGW